MKREGGASITLTGDDWGGRTQYGIAEASNPGAWIDGKITEAEARHIYMSKYVIGPGFDKITDFALQAVLIDFGVNSGPATAIKYLQRLLGVTEDGILGPKTLAAVNAKQNLTNKVVAERVKMIGHIVTKSPSQIKFLNGWLNRALEFLL